MLNAVKAMMSLGINYSASFANIYLNVVRQNYCKTKNMAIVYLYYSLRSTGPE